MRCLLIPLFLFTLQVFGSIPDNSFEPEQAKYDALQKEDSLTMARVDSLLQVVLWKAYWQRHPYMYWLLPHSVTPEVSFRSPSQGEVTDYMLRLDIEYPNMKFRIEQEQENALSFTNYYVKYLNDEGQNWQYEFTTRRSQAQTINRQKTGVRRKLWFLRAGVAATTEGYDTKHTKGLLDFSIPLGEESYVGYATNINGLEIWDVVLKIGTMEGKFYKVGRDLDWQIRFKRKINLRGGR